jgi:hypothetical protein
MDSIDNFLGSGQDSQYAPVVSHLQFLFYDILIYTAGYKLNTHSTQISNKNIYTYKKKQQQRQLKIPFSLALFLSIYV